MTSCPIPDKIRQMLARLGSPHDGEIIATARAIGRTLNAAGLDWNYLAAQLSQASPKILEKNLDPQFRPPVFWSEQVAFVCRHPAWESLTMRERKFLTDMATMARQSHKRQPSPRQTAWLESLFLKLARDAA